MSAPPEHLICGGCSAELPAAALVYKRCLICMGWLSRCAACGGADALTDAAAVHAAGHDMLGKLDETPGPERP
jgi:hypothetical protein